MLAAPTGAGAPAALTLDQLYFGTYPNYANSPLPAVTIDALGVVTGVTAGTGIRKFMDALPGLNTPNLLGQQIPVAVPDATTFPGSDYYEIGLVQYTEKMHSDLPPTTLRGYVQLNAPTTMQPQYLGPVIVAQRDRPVRIKFTNMLAGGSGGDLFIPVDTTVMGAGANMNGTGIYQQNRATLHLHGGNTPWISDGTPHQWTVPIGDTTAANQRGVSTQFVPDMFFDSTGKVVPVPKCDATAVPAITANCWGGLATQLPPPTVATNDPGQGSMTFYYTNEQSARLMFYHDHAYGITRLNVYVGEAAGYLLQDPQEAALVNGGDIPNSVPLVTAAPGTIPALQIPLVIQDKTFVPANPTTAPIYSVAVLAPGSNYNPLSTTVTFVNGACTTPPAASPVIGNTSNGFGTVILNGIVGITLTNGGSCSAPPDVVITDASLAGTGAAAFASLATLGQQDPTWSWGTANPTGLNGNGDLWFPHTYMTNQYPDNPDGSSMNAMGRWDYGMWFWPPMTLGPPGTGALVHGSVPCPTTAIPAQTCPGFPTTLLPATNSMGNGSTASLTPEAFMDTPIVNGTAYPTVTVPAGAVRFRILNAANDRSLNLSLFKADPTVTTLDGRTNTEVKMVTAAPTPGWPIWWPTDGRDGGVPDPATAGPSWIQIGNEAGFIPTPVVIPPTPVGYEYQRRSITVTNVSFKSLFMGPAERADVIVDFTGLAGQTLILYNDAPAPVPAFDARYDFYTGDPDLTGTGGAPTTLAGFGPNTRTIMQIVVAGSAPPVNMAGLQAGLPAAFKASQPAPIVPEAAYSSTYGTAFPNTFMRLQDYTRTFTPILPVAPFTPTAPVTMTLLDKTIQELFELEYGRMNATLGTELPFTNFNTQTTMPLGYVDPPTELLTDSLGFAGQPVGTLGDGTQIWKITHNGVDTHSLHFHLFNVQLVNRIGWDGTNRAPDPNEIGWKESVRMNPLEIDFVALRPMAQNLPWPIPDSIRPLDVTMPAEQFDPAMSLLNGLGNPADQVNHVVNFGQEYVWHCHLLGHEENDMMRPMVLEVAPQVPTGLTAIWNASTINLSWVDASASASQAGGGFNLRRAPDTGFTASLSIPNTAKSAGVGAVVTSTDSDPGLVQGNPYYYEVQAFSANGTSAWSAPVLAVVQIPLTITASSPTVPYGSPVPPITPIVVGLLPGDTLASLGPLACTTLAATGSPVGTYPSTCSGAVNAKYLITYLPGIVTITGAQLTITASSGTMTLGGIAPTITPSFSGFVNGETSAVLTTQPTCLTTATSTSPVGTYPSTCSGAVNANYAITYVAGTVTISAAPLTITASSQIVPFGSAVAAVTPTVLGLVPPDTIANLGPLVCLTAAVQGSPVATYPTNCSGAVNSNYTIAYVPGTVTITAVPLTITANNATRAVGAPNPVFTATYAGFVNGNTPASLTGALACTTTAAVASPAGTYPITCSGQTSVNYTITYVQGTLTVTAAAPVLSLVPTSLVFTSTVNVTTVAQTVLVSNTGGAPLRITGITLAGANPGRFGMTQNCPINGAGLAVGGSCTITVTFTPNNNTARSALVRVAVAAPAVTGTVTLTGTTVRPVATLSAASLAFGNVPINTISAPQPVTVTNTGTVPLVFTSITMGGANPGRFPQTNNCPIGGAGLAPNSSCTVTITFQPNRRVARSATLTIRNNAANSPQTVALTGTGI